MGPCCDANLKAKAPFLPKEEAVLMVNDVDYPWQPLRPGDMHGPCPGLNTLASHGVSSIPITGYLSESLTLLLEQYLPRDGVATPAQIITATQEGTSLIWQ
jgi:hypothetical protein